MVSHLVSRRAFTPYGVILYHPCGSHSHVKAEDADEPVYGEGPVCEECMLATSEASGITLDEEATIKLKRPARPKRE